MYLVSMSNGPKKCYSFEGISLFVCVDDDDDEKEEEVADDKLEYNAAINNSRRGL
jgi:hypothetical protein